MEFFFFPQSKRGFGGMARWGLSCLSNGLMDWGFFCSRQDGLLTMHGFAWVKGTLITRFRASDANAIIWIVCLEEVIGADDG